jgi:FkbM family methyltransferase
MTIWQILGRAFGIRCLEGHNLILNLFPPGAPVVDLGTHLGKFSEACHEIWGCHCYSVEADPILFAKVPVSRHLSSYNFAISGSNAPVELNLSDNLQASSVHEVAVGNKIGSVIVEGRTLETLLDEIGLARIGLLKVDIEGSEIAMFDATSDRALSQIHLITVEFHDFCGQIDPGEVNRIIDRLRSLGFIPIHWHRGQFKNYDVLFINRELCDFGFFKYIFYAHVVRNVRLTKQSLGRFLRQTFA